MTVAIWLLAAVAAASCLATVVVALLLLREVRIHPRCRCRCVTLEARDAAQLRMPSRFHTEYHSRLHCEAVEDG